jgi:hypothetical protein
MRRFAIGIALALTVAGGVAHALSDWWTPNGKSCPTFDSEEACKSYCQADPSRCGGEVQCAWKTGDTRPEC